MKSIAYTLIVLLTFAASAEEVSPDDTPRELRIYYTGPTRGFLEPCG